MSNASAVIYHALISLEHFQQKPINWCGFYITNPKNPQQLILGPFQGKVRRREKRKTKNKKTKKAIYFRLLVQSSLLVKEYVEQPQLAKKVNW